MGYTTASETHIENAKEHIRKAYRLLLDATDEYTSGSSELPDDYVQVIEEIILKLRKINRKL